MNAQKSAFMVPQSEENAPVIDLETLNAKRQEHGILPLQIPQQQPMPFAQIQPKSPYQEVNFPQQNNKMPSMIMVESNSNYSLPDTNFEWPALDSKRGDRRVSSMMSDTNQLNKTESTFLKKTVKIVEEEPEVPKNIGKIQKMVE